MDVYVKRTGSNWEFKEKINVVDIFTYLSNIQDETIAAVKINGREFVRIRGKFIDA